MARRRVPGPVGWRPARRGRVMAWRMADVAAGPVEWFGAGEGAGFLAPVDGAADVFVCFSVIAGCGCRPLGESRKAGFGTARGREGRRAENVRPLCGVTCRVAGAARWPGPAG